jgi:putative membrane protein
LVVDNNGTVKAVVIGIGGVLGLGEKTVAVAYNDVRWQVAQDGTVRGELDTTADALKAAPEFKGPANSNAAVAAPGANGNVPPQNGAAPATATAFDPQTFVNTAAPANTFEIQTSQMALQKTQNKDITDFANKMVADHTKAGQDLEAAAKSQNLSVPTGISDSMQQQVVQLQNLSGQQFEQAYVQAQVQAHDDAVNLFQGYSQSGPAGALKDFAAKTLPTLQEHQQMIHKIAGK